MMKKIIFALLAAVLVCQPADAQFFKKIFKIIHLIDIIRVWAHLIIINFIYIIYIIIKLILIHKFII